VTGYDEQRREASGIYPVYFHGSWSDHGWWWYFLAAFALKETLALLALLATGTFLVARRRALDPLTTGFLFVPPIVFTALLVVFTDIDLGVRYLLAAYPFLFLIAASVFRPGCLGIRGRRVAGALLALHVVAAVAAAPSHLAYTNALIGESDRAYRWLADSNLDWGQELRRLRTYLAGRGLARVGLAYFGRAAPELYGIEYEVPRGTLTPGTYVISANYLAGRPYFLWDHGAVYDAPADMFAPFRRITPTAVIGHSLFVYDLR
jgi:hypothetical protein